MSSIVANLKPGLDSILGIRDEIGAALKPVFLVTRTWSGTEIGDGTKKETRSEVRPSPGIRQYTNDLRITEGGAVKQGDVLLKMISKQSFPTEKDVDCSVSSNTVEKFYEVDGILYRVVNVREKHLTWDVLVRRVSDQRRS